MPTFDDYPPDLLQVPDPEAHIRAALDEAVTNMAFCLYAQDEHPDLFDDWTDVAYDKLRARLPRQLLLEAIFTLLMPEAIDLAKHLRWGQRPSNSQLEDAVSSWVQQGYGSSRRKAVD